MGFLHVAAAHKNALLLMQDARYYIVHRDVVKFRGE